MKTLFIRKKALLYEKKHCYQKRGSDIYRKSNYATFYLTVHSDNRLYIALSVEENH